MQHFVEFKSILADYLTFCTVFCNILDLKLSYKNNVVNLYTKMAVALKTIHVIYA